MSIAKFTINLFAYALICLGGIFLLAGIDRNPNCFLFGVPFCAMGVILIYIQGSHYITPKKNVNSKIGKIYDSITDGLGCTEEDLLFFFGKQKTMMTKEDLDYNFNDRARWFDALAKLMDKGLIFQNKKEKYGLTFAAKKLLFIDNYIDEEFR